MTKEYKQYLFVEVPEGANSFVIDKKHNALAFFEGKASFQSSRFINLPPGSYSIVGLANELTTDQKNEICPSIGEQISFANLLAHLGLSKQVLIIKKEEK